MHPNLEESIGLSLEFCQSLTAEDEFQELMEKTPYDRCQWLARHNERFIFRDIDWEKIYTDIFEHEDSFARYYPMMRVGLNDDSLVSLMRAMVLNDDFYAHLFELKKEEGQ